MTPFPKCLEVLNASEKIRRLNSDGCKIVHVLKRGEIGHSVLQVGQFHHFITSRFKIGLNHTTIKRMNQA